MADTTEYSRVDLIKMILEDQTELQQEELLLQQLLVEKLSKDAIKDLDEERSMGAKSADALASLAWSWTFIIIFFTILLARVVVNAVFLTRPFDPYPFILMNLILSCLAAIQAPIIMMSQNRQEEKDRNRAKNDYLINLKAEILIEDMHVKLNEILMRLEALEKSN